MAAPPTHLSSPFFVRTRVFDIDPIEDIVTGSLLVYSDEPGVFSFSTIWVLVSLVKVEEDEEGVYAMLCYDVGNNTIPLYRESKLETRNPELTDCHKFCGLLE
jgi:hypothetical protein